MSNSEHVGYRRPPKSGQFKPGQSGNPSGRKKAPNSVKNDLMAELSEMISIHENGRERRVTKQRALLKTLTAVAIKGDIRAINAILTWTRNFGAGETTTALGEILNLSDLNSLQSYLERELGKREQHAPPVDPARQGHFNE